MTQQAIEILTRLLGAACFPEILERVEPDDGNALLGKRRRQAPVEARPSAVAGNQYREGVAPGTDRRDFDDRKLADVLRRRMYLGRRR